MTTLHDMKTRLGASSGDTINPDSSEHERAPHAAVSSTSITMFTDALRCNDIQAHEAGIYEMLTELRRVNDTHATLSKAVSQARQSVAIQGNRMSQLETELAALRKQCDEMLNPVKSSYHSAERSLMKERKALEEIQTMCDKTVSDLKAKLCKIEVDLGALKAKFLNHAGNTELAVTTDVMARVERVELDNDHLKHAIDGIQEQVDAVAQQLQSSQDSAINDTYSYSFPSAPLSSHDNTSPAHSLAAEMSEQEDVPNEKVPFSSSDSTDSALQPIISSVPNADPNERRLVDQILVTYIAVVAAFMFQVASTQGLVGSPTSTFHGTRLPEDPYPPSWLRAWGGPGRTACKKVGRFISWRIRTFFGVWASVVASPVSAMAVGVVLAITVRGQLWHDPRTVAKHKLQEQLEIMEMADLSQQQQRVENAILLGTISSTSTLAHPPSLPVRCRDSEHGNEVPISSPSALPKETEECPDKGEARAPISPVAPSEDTVAARMSLLSATQSKVDLAYARIQKSVKLAFTSVPLTLLDPQPELDLSNEDTVTFCNVQQLLLERQAELEELLPLGHKDADRRRDALLRHICMHIHQLSDIVSREWENVKLEHVLRSNSRRGDKAKAMQPFVIAGLIMVVALRSLASVAYPKAQFALATVEAVIYGAFVFSSAALTSRPTLTLAQAEVLRSIPRDPETIISTLGVEPTGIVHYACCVACGYTYAPNPRKPDDPYPHRCTFQETDKPPCNNVLVYKQRPGMEEAAKHAWDPVLKPLKSRWRDIWEAPILRTFMGPDKKTLFAHQPDGSEQSKWLASLVNALHKGSLKKLLQARKGYLVALAELNGVVPRSRKFTKTEYAQALLKWVDGPHDVLASILIPPVFNDATSDFHLAENEYDISKFRVLDNDTIRCLREDIAATIFPSWMERPPRNFGSPSHGKLKADQWRTACTVSMVITLTRLWGSSGVEREKVLLNSFLHLVCAVDLATRRSMSHSWAARFDYHINRYLSSLRMNFDHNLVPNHHLSLHLQQCLELFGPVHAWWSFPFERFIGMLQRLNINHKSSMSSRPVCPTVHSADKMSADQMPSTFMRYFYIGSNVRWLMASTEWPEANVYERMMQRYHEAFRDAAKGTRRADFTSYPGQPSTATVAYDEKKETSLPRDVYNTLVHVINFISNHGAPSAFASVFEDTPGQRPRLHTKAQFVPSWQHQGVTYSTKNKHERDSFILFNNSGPSTLSSFPGAGQISDIFLHARTLGDRRIVEPFFVVDEFCPLSTEHATQDPYRLYPDLNTRLFYNTSNTTKKVLSLEQVRNALWCVLWIEWVHRRTRVFLKY
ncbi:hypothetical protein C8Q78DRAFT_988356 [Trametes maxima]|nr:hypothetical protein C8Q78DRAFT_988356 [Trametes maxima]